MDKGGMLMHCSSDVKFIPLLENVDSPPKLHFSDPIGNHFTGGNL